MKQNLNINNIQQQTESDYRIENCEENLLNLQGM